MKVVINLTGEPTPDLYEAINKYNECLETTANKILALSIRNNKDIEVRHLYGLFDKMSVINNIKSRKTAEKLLDDVITQYGLILQDYREQNG